MNEANFTGLRWWWTLLPGAAVAVLGYVLIFLLAYAFVVSQNLATGGEPDAARTEAALMMFALVGLPLIHFFLVILAARWVAYRANGRFVLYGLSVGLAALVGHELIGLYFGPFRPDLAALFLLITLAGGWIGGLWGRIAVERQEALYLASREIETSQEPETVVRAIGEHLAGPDVSGVAVWRTASSPENGSENDLVLLAAWTPRKDPAHFEERLDGQELLSPESPEDRMPVVLRGRNLSGLGNGSFGGREVQTVLLLPLRSAEAGQFGLLAVAFRRRRRVFRRVARDYQTISTQAALALENLRLVEEARRAGIAGERQRLANEIHDTLAQGFNSIAINLDTATNKLPPVPEPVRRLLDLSRSTARESLAETRRLVWALRPEALDRHSLPEAIQLLTERWSQESGVAAGAVLVGTPRQLPPEVEAALLRTAQETLSNARKHAWAGRIMLTLSYMQETVTLDARDDGVGFDPEQVAGEVRDQSSGGFGLKAMRERVEHLGGTVHIESAPGEGT
ncbi:MAG: histidine kinase [Rubrobacteraceae bacterium]